MKEDTRPKFPCPFCDRKYRIKELPATKFTPQINRINCQFCLVDVNIYQDKVFSIDYRLHDKVHDRLFVNVYDQFTTVYLYPKQKKIKNPPPGRFFRFNTCRMVQPKDALALAQKLTDLLIFS